MNIKKLLPTSTAGSLPKPLWLAEPETLWSPWKLQGDALIDGKLDALRIALQEQQRAGIDIVSDGEQSRQHFVTTFIEHLKGVDFEKRQTVRIRDRYDASVPTVVGPVSRTKPVFVEDAKFLRSQTDKPIKWALPGPMTMVDTLYDAHYKNRETLAFEPVFGTGHELVLRPRGEIKFVDGIQLPCPGIEFVAEARRIHAQGPLVADRSAVGGCNQVVTRHRRIQEGDILAIERGADCPFAGDVSLEGERKSLCVR